MTTFKLLRGYYKPTLTQEWEELMDRFQPITTYTPPDYTINNPFGTRTLPGDPIWIVTPGLVRFDNPLPNYTTYTIPTYTQYTPPNYTTITNTPGTGYVTLPYNGTINTATGFSLTTSNPNGITYTMGGIGGILSTGTATFRSGAFTTKFM